MKKIGAFRCAVTVMVFFAVAFASVSVGAENGYVGAKKCKMCHNSTKAGKQYTIWSESAHSKAYENLASEKAKAIAKEKGIEYPQKSDACLKCHAPSHSGKA